MKSLLDKNMYPTVRELLELPIFSRSRLLGGESGLDRYVTGINTSDNPDYALWISPGEMMISTCYSIYEDIDAMHAYIPTLVENGLVGFCIKSTQYLNSITPDYMIEQADKYGFPLIELDIDAQFSLINNVLTNEISMRQNIILQNTIDANRMLTRTITEGATLDELARQISDLSMGSILIVDSVNNTSSMYLRPIDDAALSSLNETSKIDIIVNNSDTHRIALGNNLYGFLYIYNPMQKPPLSEQLLSQVLTIIPLEISREQSIRQNGDSLFASFLFHILSDPIIDDQWEQKRASDFNLNLSDNHLILRIKIETSSSMHKGYNSSFQQTLLIGNMRSTFNKLGLDVRIVNSVDEYIVLLNTPEANVDFRNLIQYLPKLIDDLSRNYTELAITCGCGRPHHGINGLIQTDNEARIAIKSALSSGRRYINFDDLGLLRLLHSVNPEDDITSFITETLNPLIQNDMQKNTNLIDTLDCYFDHHGNIKKMSEAMYAHYNTIAYRIKSIQELTGRDLRDRNDSFMMEIALFLYKFRNGNQ